MVDPIGKMRARFFFHPFRERGGEAVRFQEFPEVILEECIRFRAARPLEGSRSVFENGRGIAGEVF